MRRPSRSIVVLADLPVPSVAPHLPMADIERAQYEAQERSEAVLVAGGTILRVAKERTK